MIRTLLFGAAWLLASLISIGAAQVKSPENPPGSTEGTTSQEPVRFVTYELFVDPANESLAAWQVRFEDPTGAAKLVGVEGGSDPSFKGAPFYDPKALQGGAVVLAAFDTGGTGPTTETLVARVHLAITGDLGHDPEFNVTAEMVASPDGPIQGATARLAR